MSAYHRRYREFEGRLAVRHDELRSAAVTVNDRGEVILSAVPYLIFPSTDCAEQFVRRVLLQRERLSVEGKPNRRRSQ
jgi:hypothetical protein